MKKSEDWLSFARKNLLVLILVGVGLVLVLAGLWPAFKPSQPQVEIVKEEEPVLAKTVVDVAGAVEKPGVYEVEGGGRIGHALTLAGGLSSNADRGWVARFVNLAEPVSDGMKIYIPEKGESSEVVTTNYSQLPVEGTSGVTVNINLASAGELDALKGIGEKRAGDIINNRPYQSTEELVTKAGIPQGVYEGIKDQVSVY